MLKKFFFVTFVFILITKFSYAGDMDKTKMYETCADQLFVSHFDNQLEDYLSLSVKTKIDKSQPYEWFYEDCEKQAETKPISFNLKSSLYREDLDEITSSVFERCADERYVMEFGEAYSQFLNLSIKEKIRQQIDYEWFVEGCEEEYTNYPIKFKIKYY